MVKYIYLLLTKEQYGFGSMVPTQIIANITPKYLAEQMGKEEMDELLVEFKKVEEKRKIRDAKKK